MKQKKIIETMETAGWEDGVQQSVNAMSCMIRMTRMRDTAAGEHPTRDDLSGEEEEKHDGTSDNRRAAGRGGGRNDDPTGGEKSLYPHSDSLLS